LFFYEDDGGNDNGATITLSATFKPTDAIEVGASVEFSIDDRDEELGWVEIFHYDQSGVGYYLSPQHGSAILKVRQ
jgi:hypothetical protein